MEIPFRLASGKRVVPHIELRLSFGWCCTAANTSAAPLLVLVSPGSLRCTMQRVDGFHCDMGDALC